MGTGTVILFWAVVGTVFAANGMLILRSAAAMPGLQASNCFSSSQYL